MASNRKATLLALIAAAVVAAVIVWLTASTARDQLARSLAVVVTEKLGSTYSIKSQKLADGETDLGGEWWLQVDSGRAALLDRMSKAGFGEADDSDDAYYKSAVQEAFGPGLKLADYRVLRAEMALGDGTICQSLPCNVAAVVRESDGTLFLSISKT